jgi:archaellum component FlaF (FlaF/FlaG flagellin family)
MQKKILAIFLIIFCIILSIILAGVLMRKTDDSANTGKNASMPTVRMIYSFPANTSSSNILSSQSNTNESSSLLNPKKLVITDVQSDYTSDTFLVTVINNGSSQTILTDVLVNGYSAKIENELVIPPNSCAVLLVRFNGEIVFLRTYEIQVKSLEGNSATYFKVCW